MLNSLIGEGLLCFLIGDQALIILGYAIAVT